MSVFKNIGIGDYFKRYGYKYGLLRGIFMAFPVHIVEDYENKKILYYHKTKKYLERKYGDAMNKDPEGLKFKDVKCNNPIWIYWKQGIENAPDIVKICVNSVRKNCSQEVIILDEKNVNKYVEFPNYIVEKMSHGNMSTAAYSDLLRFSLLEHFGGTWIDATVYLTDAIPEYISSSDIFAFQDSFGLIKNPAMISNWFIHCKSSNKIMRETRNMVFEYWKRQEYVVEYLFTYIFLMIAFENHSDEYRKMPYANSEYCHMLFESFDEEYNLKKFEYITTISKIHKLSYKINEDIFKNENNFYNFIVNRERK